MSEKHILFSLSIPSYLPHSEGDSFISELWHKISAVAVGVEEVVGRC